MVTLTDKEAELVASTLKSYMKSADGRCHAVYCTAGYVTLQQVVKKIEKAHEKLPDNRI